MQDLIYAGSNVEAIIRKIYPNVVISDASDFIHEHRFEIKIPDEEGLTIEKYFISLMLENIELMSFSFQLFMRNVLNLQSTKKRNELLLKIATQFPNNEYIQLYGKLALESNERLGIRIKKEEENLAQKIWEKKNLDSRGFRIIRNLNR